MIRKMALFAIFIGSLITITTSADDHVETGKVPGQFIWGDLFTDTPSVAIEFYTELFGWTTKIHTEGAAKYTLFLNGEKAIGGIVYRPSEADDSQEANARWIGYVYVENIESSIESIKKEGGKILLKPFSIESRGQIAITSDSQGSLVGLIQPSTPKKANNGPENGDWVWVQLFSRNPENAVEFYSKVFGYEISEESSTSVENDFLLSIDETPIASLSPIPSDLKASGGWLGVVKTDDVPAAVEKAISLGGKVISNIHIEGVKDTYAIISDPLGGAIALYSVPSE